MSRKIRCTQLGLESLELRENPATVTQLGGHVLIYATDPDGSNVTVTRAFLGDNLKITDHVTGVVTVIPQTGLQFTPVTFMGGAKNDVFNAANTLNPVNAHGQGGNDTLTGGFGRDRLDGGDGSDNLYGGGGGDTLYGRDGIDRLYGQGGDDFLDDGNDSVHYSSETFSITLRDLSDGGDGTDFLAYKPVLNGTTDTDVNQTQTPTCWMNAPMAAAAKAGINLAGRITYLGDGEYRVKLLDASNTAHYQYVSLEGGKLSFEPTPNGDESWVVLYQRAIQQQLGKEWDSVSDYGGGWPDSVLPMLTGRPAKSYGSDLMGGGQFDTTNNKEMQFIKAQLDAGKLVCADTRQGDYGSFHVGGSVNTGKLCGAHCYSVDSVDMVNKTVTLRNPWGVDQDGGADPHVKWHDGNNDGYVTISFSQFYGSMWSYTVS